MAPPAGRAAEIRAAVEQRYAESPSYRAVLAAESARSVREAEAAAEIANINARAIARAQQHLLSELGEWGAETAALQPASAMPLAGPLPAPEPARAAAAILLAQQQRLQQGMERAPVAAAARLEEEAYGREMAPARREPIVVTEVQRAGLTVRLIEEVTRPAYHAGHAAAPADRESMEQESMLLDEEILFRNDPTFDETRGPEPMAANLIEFPRQLVAPRRARPRLAEGPLREEPAEAAAQLRIFEVEAEHIAVAPAAETQMAEWSSILLPAQPAMTFFSPADGEEADYALAARATDRAAPAAADGRAAGRLADHHGNAGGDRGLCADDDVPDTRAAHGAVAGGGGARSRVGWRCLRRPITCSSLPSRRRHRGCATRGSRCAR